jgi:hypothetical protein
MESGAGEDVLDTDSIITFFLAFFGSIVIIIE